MKPHRSSLIAFTLFALALPNVAAASARDAVFGCWLGEDGGSILYIHEKGDDLVGEIAALRDVRYTAEDKEGEEGTLRKDHNNPDPTKRDQTLRGLNILQDFKYDDGWEGKIYDPGSGDTYSATIKVDADGKLELHGYLGFAWLGRTVYYVSPETNAKARDELYAISETEDPCAARAS